ncbi:AAA family ATPase [Chamaesiphon sp. VAR_69_metabat_338]|uniref:AAA family ATPase n=1 Tax=Chamaesiphon sp. VAR_69_metabat_338 TaxID=2964704 RepID=UPI00286DB2B8|nr:AAA family ATPase [Chamaesiphon sp. VAR_69_metabat_338]
MDIAEALKIADNLVFTSRNKHLNDLERSIIEGVCQGKKYSQIANDNYCEQSHVNDVAAGLWKAISEAVGEQVKKANFKSTIERHQSKNISSSFVEQISLVNICSEVTLNHHPNHSLQQAAKTNTPQYLKTIPDLVTIYDRTQELNSLKNWILTEKCRSIVISGTAGIGKTALARQLVEDIKDEFEEIVWQSLGCQRSVVEFIDRNLIASLNIEALPEPPLDLEARLSLLLEHFREHRCLIVLDDLDRLFSSGELAGNYTDEYREYRELFRRIWEMNHQSCLLLLSREEPSEMAVLVGTNSSIHALALGGLGDGGREIFRARGLSDEERWDYAIEYLGGNPAYLESVSIAINKLFGGRVGEFCKYTELFLTEDIKLSLTHQFARLSPVEREVIRSIASETIPVTISKIIESLEMSPADVGNAIVSLSRRGLIERSETDDGAIFSLQSIVRLQARSIE